MQDENDQVVSHRRRGRNIWPEIRDEKDDLTAPREPGALRDFGSVLRKISFQPEPTYGCVLVCVSLSLYAYLSSNIYCGLNFKKGDRTLSVCVAIFLLYTRVSPTHRAVAAKYTQTLTGRSRVGEGDLRAAFSTRRKKKRDTFSCV